MVLSERLHIIANQIQKGQTMADIGTDHGFLPLYLWENGVCPKVIMTDVSEASLSKARGAFQSQMIRDEDVHFRCGDGLAVIERNEVNVVVIAGMGGVLMTQILGADLAKTLSFDKYILQPRNGSGKLRFWLEKAGFEIESECFAEEGKFICEILVVIPPTNFTEKDKVAIADMKEKVMSLAILENYPDTIQYEIPRNLQLGSENIFNLFINKKLNIEKNILNAMVCGEIAQKEKINKIKERIEFLESILHNNAQ